VLAVEHEPGEVRLQRVPVLLQESLHVVRHRAGKMFDPAKQSTFESCVSSCVAVPGSGAFMTPGSGILDGKKSGCGIWDPGSWMIIADHISESLGNNSLG
jgi:hypothetical protein